METTPLPEPTSKISSNSFNYQISIEDIKRDEIVYKMKLTSKEETDILSKRIEKLEKKIENLEKRKKTKSSFRGIKKFRSN